jgi:uncharacterized glyoxalase superfamily protein PhnB
MKIESYSISLTVDKVNLSSQFLTNHFGFSEKMSDEGFASLTHSDSGINVIFLQKGIQVLPEFMRNETCSGIILAFVTKDIEQEEQRLKGEGVSIVLPIQTEEWGEKLFMVQDPNGVIIQLVQWV